MKLFQTVQKNLRVLGIAANQPLFNKKLVLICLLYGLSLTLCAMYLFLEAETFLEYTTNIYITTALLVICSYFAILISKLEKFFNLIDDLEKSLEKKSENVSSKAIYDEIDRSVEKWSEIGCFVIARVTPVCWIAPIASISYYQYITTDLENGSFELPLLLWYPFNWRNPFAYLIAVSFQYQGITYCLTFVACLISFGLGIFLIAISATNDLKNDLRLINQNAKAKRNRSEVLKRISGFVHFHWTLKKFAHDFLDIYQPVFMEIYAWSLVTMCGVMLLIQMELQEHSNVTLFAIVFYASYAFGVICFICELGQRLTNAFEEMGIEIESFEWHLFSSDIQKLLAVLLMVEQRPVYLECFGSISGNREAFKKVVNNGFSYFMILRQFMK